MPVLRLYGSPSPIPFFHPCGKRLLPHPVHTSHAIRHENHPYLLYAHPATRHLQKARPHPHYYNKPTYLYPAPAPSSNAEKGAIPFSPDAIPTDRDNTHLSENRPDRQCRNKSYGQANRKESVHLNSQTRSRHTVR